ncbi:FecCD family ABC transporter permease [Amycolatopsis taiwanensis]|uniref:ABC transporter permease n=1 Tax=Amycolatopsis taiwanensis TaxID=342230 RepID=A0A9W6VGG6_9PSEU|nr:iron chelate uptake ABC transporter family permease subunit [Amycolatopsis taiwanensis]GLY66472.1 ABC transporter permease [Amycolatopsis taiwanensis]
MRSLRAGRFSLRYRPRALAVGAGCLLVTVIAGIVSLGSGDYPMSPAEVMQALTGNSSPADEFIVGQLRLPRLVAAMLTGAALALAGAVFQALVRNPLGSPDLLGVTQGAATGALATVAAGGNSAVLAGGAAAGGLAAGITIFLLAWRRGVHGYRLILVGIGVAAVLTGVNGYLLTRSQLTEAARAVLWLTGSLDGRGWPETLPLIVAMVPLVPVVLLGCGRGLRVLELADDTAYGLGVRVQRVRLVLLLSAVLLVSFAAATAGPVSFVALAAPQLARRMTGSPGPNLLPSLCTGAALLVIADWVGGHLVPGHQLPVGVVTGLLGGAYLVWLLAVERRAGRI